MSKVARGLRIKTPEQFNNLADHLVTEMHRLWDHWDLWRGLDGLIDEYLEEFNQSAQFWNLTLQAHKDAVILRLSRLYDPHAVAHSLPNFLATIRTAVQTQSPSVAVTPDHFDGAKLEADLLSVSESDPVVSRLLRIRNDYLAHRASKFVSSGSFDGLPRLNEPDLRTLMERTMRIADSYSRLCGRPVVLLGYPGRDDYKHTLKLIRLGLQSIKKEHEDELQRLRDLGLLDGDEPDHPSSPASRP